MFHSKKKADGIVCEEHKQKAETYCRTCSKALCQECKGKHEGHQLADCNKLHEACGECIADGLRRLEEELEQASKRKEEIELALHAPGAENAFIQVRAQLKLVEAASIQQMKRTAGISLAEAKAKAEDAIGSVTDSMKEIQSRIELFHKQGKNLERKKFEQVVKLWTDLQSLNAEAPVPQPDCESVIADLNKIKGGDNMMMLQKLERSLTALNLQPVEEEKNEEEHAEKPAGVERRVEKGEPTGAERRLEEGGPAGAERRIEEGEPVGAERRVEKGEPAAIELLRSCIISPKIYDKMKDAYMEVHVMGVEKYVVNDEGKLGDTIGKLMESLLKCNSTLKCLTLSGCGLTGIGGEAIGAGLAENKTLVELNLGAWFGAEFQNKIGDRGAIAIAHTLLTNRTLRTLNLRLNNITSLGLQALATALEENAVVKEIDCRDNSNDEKVELPLRIKQFY